MSMLVEKSEGIAPTDHAKHQQTRRLGDITRIRTGKLDANAQRPGGQFPFFTCGEEILQIDHFAFDTEAVLLAGNGNFNLKWYRGKFNAYQRTYVIEPNGVDGKWLFYAMQSALPTITGGNRGSTVRFIRIGDITECRLIVPSLPDQRRIVAEIEQQFTRLDAGVAALRRTQANLKRYRAAVLKAACEGRLVPTEAELARENARVLGSIPTGDFDSPRQSKQAKVHSSTPSAFETGEAILARILNERRQNWAGRGKYSEPTGPDTTDLSELPEGWTWSRLEQIGVTYGGLTKNPKRAKLPKQLPYLRVANVYANELRLKEIEYIGVADSELEKLLVRKGDLLIVEGNGSKDQIGRLAIWDGSIDSCVHQNHLIKVRPVEPLMSKWILHWLQSPGGRQFVELVASSTSGLFTLSVNKVGNLPIPVPPLAEQTRTIAEVERRLSVVEELESDVKANLQRTIRLRQSILQNAFQGNRP